MNSSLVGGVVAGAGALALAGGVGAAGARGLESDSDLKSFAGAVSVGVITPVLAGSAAAMAMERPVSPKGAQFVKGTRIGMAGTVAAALGAGVIYAAS